MENNELQILEVSALEAQTRAEIDMQVATAKKYPRDLKRTINNVLALATVDQQTAIGCFYSLKRGENKIEGPSVRLAEIVASSWGNLRSGARTIADDGKTLTSQGFCHDLETNTAIQIEVKAKITNKEGKRYNDDMVVMTGNAANAKALRNAVFRVIPMAVFNSIMTEIKNKAIGSDTGEALETRFKKALIYFEKLGVSNERVLNTIGKKTLADIEEEDLILLTGLKTSLADKEITLEEAFPDSAKETNSAKAQTATNNVAEKIKSTPKA